MCEWLSNLFVCDPPLWGGLLLYRSSTGSVCSTAFYAKSQSYGKPFIMTAGHCGGAGTNWDAYQPRTGRFHQVGPMHHSEYDGAPDPDDHGIVTIENAPGWDPRPWVYVHASSTTVEDPSDTIHSDDNRSKGMRVCLSGAVTGTDCGDVTELGVGGLGGYAEADPRPI